MNKQKGIAQIAVMVIMLVMAVALPITTNLVKKSQENRSKAASIGLYYIKNQYGVCTNIQGGTYDGCMAKDVSVFYQGKKVCYTDSNCTVVAVAPTPIVVTCRLLDKTVTAGNYFCSGDGNYKLKCLSNGTISTTSSSESVKCSSGCVSTATSAECNNTGQSCGNGGICSVRAGCATKGGIIISGSCSGTDVVCCGTPTCTSTIGACVASGAGAAPGTSCNAGSGTGSGVVDTSYTCAGSNICCKKTSGPTPTTATNICGTANNTVVKEKPTGTAACPSTYSTSFSDAEATDGVYNWTCKVFASGNIVGTCSARKQAGTPGQACGDGGTCVLNASCDTTIYSKISGNCDTTTGLVCCKPKGVDYSKTCPNGACTDKTLGICAGSPYSMSQANPKSEADCLCSTSTGSSVSGCSKYYIYKDGACKQASSWHVSTIACTNLGYGTCYANEADCIKANGGTPTPANNWCKDSTEGCYGSPTGLCKDVVGGTGYIGSAAVCKVNGVTGICCKKPTTQTCTSWDYNAWSSCTNGKQTRTVKNSYPTGCTGGNPVLEQSCTNDCTGTIKQCASTTSWQQCSNGKWGAAQTCGTGKACTGAGECVNACTSGTLFTATRWWYNGNACVSGPAGNTCVGCGTGTYACYEEKTACENANKTCTHGETKCYSTTQWQLCDEDTWLNPQTCPNGQKCENGKCSTTCTYQCTTALGPKGDGNCDGKINELDFAVWLNEYKTKKPAKADFNCDGKIEIDDFSRWNDNFIKK